MKILKAILGIILLLIVGFLILGAVSRKEFTTSQSTIINAPQSLVYNTVNDLSTWDSWSPWVEMDPSNVSTMGEKYVGKGGYYTWEGEKTGSGKMEITDADAPNMIKTHVSFDGQGEADANFTFEPVEGGTKTSWSFASQVGFPMNALMVLMRMEKTMDKSYARGLELLKEKVEGMGGGTGSLSVQTKDYPGHNFVIHREKIKMEDMKAFFSKHLPALGEAAGKANLQMAGMPCGLYFSWEPQTMTTDMAAAMPVALEAEIPTGMEFFKTNPGKALQVDYYGDYSGIKAAHDAIEAHVKASGVEYSWPCIEQYVTDPGTEPDTSKWLTRVIYPLQ